MSSRAGSGRGLGRVGDGWGRVGDGSDCNALLTGVTGVLHVDDMAGMRNRLKDFAKLNPIDSVKGVLWGAVPGIGSYNQFGEDGFLSLIRHCNGDEVLIPEGQSVITKKYKACELFLDCFCFCSESPTDPLAHVLQGCQIWTIQVSSPYSL